MLYIAYGSRLYMHLYFFSLFFTNKHYYCFFSKQHIQRLEYCQNKCILTLLLPSRIPYIVNLTMIGVKSLSNIVLRIVFSICSHFYTNNTVSYCKCVLKYLISETRYPHQRIIIKPDSNTRI